jgi:hypothetical protein
MNPDGDLGHGQGDCCETDRAFPFLEYGGDGRSEPEDDDEDGENLRHERSCPAVKRGYRSRRG